MSVSVVLSTFNEEKNIEECLNSIKNIADEIVLVDGSSTDKTVSIAEKFGAKIKVTDNPKIFLINRQKAIDMATKDWIFQIDADERATPELIQEMRDIVSDHKRDKGVNGYWIPRKNWFLGKFLMKGGQYPDYMLRLYKRGKGRFLLKDVHEQVIIDGKVEYLTHALLHYPYKNFHEYLVKWHRYNDVFARQISDELRGRNKLIKIIALFSYVILKPTRWFLFTYLRHKGFSDLWPGFVFSLYSALRFPASYFVYRRKYLGEDIIA